MLRRTITQDGVDLELHALGGVGAPLLFVHATGFHARVWAPVAACLLDAFECVAVDVRGHGGSTLPPDGSIAWEGLATDVLAAVEALGLDRPYGVGHSAGATALLRAEATRPGTVRALWGYEPVLFPSEGERSPSAAAAAAGQNPLAAGARRRRDVFGSRQEAHDRFSSRPPLSSLDPAVLTAYLEHGLIDQEDGTVRLACRGETEARFYEMAPNHDTFRRLGEVGCPVTLAHGTMGGSLGPPLIDLVATQIPNCRVEAFAGLGHFGPLEDPVGAARSIRHAFASA